MYCDFPGGQLSHLCQGFYPESQFRPGYGTHQRSCDGPGRIPQGTERGKEQDQYGETVKIRLYCHCGSGRFHDPGFRAGT